jgi:hypothetical protein
MLTAVLKNPSATPIGLLFRMDCRIKSGNDDEQTKKNKKRRGGTPKDVVPKPPHLAMRRASCRDAPAFRRSTAALA